MIDGWLMADWWLIPWKNRIFTISFRENFNRLFLRHSSTIPAFQLPFSLALGANTVERLLGKWTGNHGETMVFVPKYKGSYIWPMGQTLTFKHTQLSYYVGYH